MKLSLPFTLRKLLITSLSLALTSTIYSGTEVQASDFILNNENTLNIDYSDNTTIQNLNNGTLQLGNTTTLLLSNCGKGNGKTYALFTGVSCILDAEGNEIELNSSNNKISQYFDTSQPGSAFWADATLQLTSDGTLQLIRHEETVKDSLIIKDTHDYSYSLTTLRHYSAITANAARDNSWEAINICLEDNGSVIFSENNALGAETYHKSTNTGLGGAISSGNFMSPISITGNGEVHFVRNFATMGGGAIATPHNGISILKNGDVRFSSNAAESHEYYAFSCGGAVYSASGDINLIGNYKIEFSENTVFSEYTYNPNEYYGTSGGAIHAESGVDIHITSNNEVTFINNKAICEFSNTYGGAIYGANDIISIDGNQNVSFSQNVAVYGGAIFGNHTRELDGRTYETGYISFNANASIVFDKNAAIYGGAIFGTGDITFNGNKNLAFNENNSMSGGAIMTDGWLAEITITDNDSVIFSKNIVTSAPPLNEIDNHSNNLNNIPFYGGAIYASDKLSIQNNNSVLFEKNTEISSDGQYRLRSIYEAGEWATISLSAPEGKIIEFRDSIYTGYASDLILNDDYIDANGIKHKQNGDIIFTGAYTETHLAEVKGRDASAEEIINSRTSEVQGATYLYGGRLLIEDGAIYKSTGGIVATDGSNATIRVKNATIGGENGVLTFNAGTTLELAGTNTIIGSVNMCNDSTLAFSSSEKQEMTTIQGDLIIKNALSISEVHCLQTNNKILLYVKGNVDGWNPDNITIQSSLANTLTWINDFLVLNYNAETFKDTLPYQGTVLYTTGQQDESYSLYESISFEGISGGALNGNVSLRYNENIIFSNNVKTNSCGSAISNYGNGSLINIIDNGDVTFCGNASENAATWGGGGAINGDGGTTISMCNNGDIVFCSNIITNQLSPLSALCGAIYASSDIWIQNNDSVLFEKNALISDGNYRLRSIYASPFETEDEISLSAADGKSIEFRDSIYITSGTLLKLNEEYTNEEGFSYKQKGDIIFTGAYTEAHLAEIKGSVGTEEEIINSLTSEVYSMTLLYGGRLKIEEGAIFKGCGITALAESESTILVKNATLSHEGYKISFNAGTTLEIIGNSSVNANVEMLSGSSLILQTGASLTMNEVSNLILEADSHLQLGIGATLNLSCNIQASEGLKTELKNGASVINGVTTISNNGAADIVTLDIAGFANNNLQKVENAKVIVNSESDTNVDYQLINSSLEMRGQGTLTASHAQNTISSVRAIAGCINIMNVAASDSVSAMKLTTLELGDFATFGAYKDDTASAVSEAIVQVNKSAIFGKNTTINANLELMVGCALTLHGELNMGSDLIINGTITLDGELLTQILSADLNTSIVLATGIDNLYLNGSLCDNFSITDRISACTYFANLLDDNQRHYLLTYETYAPGERILSVHVLVPEPTTSTLSIIALAGLLFKRRRR